MVRRLLVVLILGAVAAAQISPKFKAAGRVALDAVQRAENAQELTEVGFQQRMTLAEQSLDSAKRAAGSAADQKAFNVLQLYADAINGYRLERSSVTSDSPAAIESARKMLDQYGAIQSACKSEGRAAVIDGKVPVGSCAAEQAKLDKVASEASGILTAEMAAQDKRMAARSGCYDQHSITTAAETKRRDEIFKLQEQQIKEPDNDALARQLRSLQDADNAASKADVESFLKCLRDVRLSQGGAQ